MAATPMRAKSTTTLPDDEIESRARQQAALAELGLFALGPGALAGIVDHALHALCDTLAVELAAVAECLPGREALTVRAGVGWRRGMVGATTLPGGEGWQCGYTLRRRRPVVMADAARERRFEIPAVMREHGVVSDMGVVIGGGGRPFGIVSVHSRCRRDFCPDEQAFLAAVAGVLAAAVRRDRAERALREAEVERRLLLEAVLRAQEEERARIAVELHDDTVQAMAATLVGIDRLRRSQRNGDLERSALLAEAARESLATALERTRRLIFELRPPVLEASGVGPAVADLAARIEEESGIQIALDVDVGRFPFYLEDVVYRTVQEAVANVRQHARDRVAIGLHRDRDGVYGTVADDGVGLREGPRRAEHAGGRIAVGLEALRQRLQLVGGALRVDRRRGGGTCVSFELPVPRRFTGGWGDVTGGRAARRSLNEAAARRLARRSASDGDGRRQPRVRLEFLCECFRRECARRVLLSPADWSRHHDHDGESVVAPGHVDARHERVVRRGRAYWVVAGSEAAAPTDGRHARRRAS